jgi:hypothetical protein
VLKFAATILLLAVLGQTFNQGIYYLDYLADKATYAKNCVNKARPPMHCNGKCQLMKKIQEEEKKEQQAPEMKLAKMEVISSKSWFVTAIPVLLSDTHQYNIIYKNGSPVDQSYSFFHPPCA